MFYLLEDIYFPEGYSIEDINCIDLSIAQTLGIFDNQLYFDYSAYLSIDGNFCNEIYFDSEKALSFLGFEKVPFSEFNKSTDIIATIKKSLELGYPMLLLTNYECLYYSDGYKVQDVNDHLVIIVGYDEDKGIVVIKDFETIRRKMIMLTKGQLFYMHRLKTSMFMEIVSDTMGYFEVSQEEFLQKNIFAVKPMESRLASTIEVQGGKRDSLQDFFVKNCTNELKMFKIHEEYIKLTNDDEINRFFRYIRRPYLGGMRLIVDYISTFVVSNEDIQQSSERFLQDIDCFISLSHKLYLKDKVYSPDRLAKAITEIKASQKKYADAVKKSLL